MSFVWESTISIPNKEESTILIQQNDHNDRLSKQAVPEHVAIIMDGNRRWAKKNGQPISFGHRRGAENLSYITEEASSLGIKTLTVYSFSTENWHRSPFELLQLIKIMEEYLEKKRAELVEKGIRLTTIGNLDPFPKSLRHALDLTIEATKKGNKFNLVLALGYGGRDEICRAIKRIVQDSKRDRIKEENISEELVNQYLDTHGYKDPDLLIRTAGECRLSNFLLWQLAYTEIFISQVSWPDFTKENLKEAVEKYQNRMRRYGK